MRRSSARAGTAPLAALAALFAVGLGLSIYAGALPTADREQPTDPETVLQEVRRAATTAGVLDPDSLAPIDSLPAGWTVNVTLETPAGRRHLGPPPAANAARAARTVTVEREAGVRTGGRLSVAVGR